MNFSAFSLLSTERSRNCTNMPSCFQLSTTSVLYLGFVKQVIVRNWWHAGLSFAELFCWTCSLFHRFVLHLKRCETSFPFFPFLYYVHPMYRAYCGWLVIESSFELYSVSSHSWIVRRSVSPHWESSLYLHWQLSHSLSCNNINVPTCTVKCVYSEASNILIVERVTVFCWIGLAHHS